MRFFLIIAISLYSTFGYCDQEEDKKSGVCAMYLYIAHTGNFGNYKVKPVDALALADNEKRAIQYGKMYIEKIKDHQAARRDTSSLITEGVKSCYDIGLKLK